MTNEDGFAVGDLIIPLFQPLGYKKGFSIHLWKSQGTLGNITECARLPIVPLFPLHQMKIG
jgi:hypothetical protein